MPHDEDLAPEPKTQDSTPNDPDIEEKVTEDIGGVQGEAPEEDGQQQAVAPASFDAPADAPAPDSGEIEWAGQVVKKPPHPGS